MIVTLETIANRRIFGGRANCAPVESTWPAVVGRIRGKTPHCQLRFEQQCRLTKPAPNLSFNSHCWSLAKKIALSIASSANSLAQVRLPRRLGECASKRWKGLYRRGLAFPPNSVLGPMRYMKSLIRRYGRSEQKSWSSRAITEKTIGSDTRFEMIVC